MEKRHFFVIGGGSLQADLILLAKKEFIVHLFDYNEDCFCRDLADIFHLISIDKKEEILKLAKEYNIIGIATCATELGNLSTCFVGEHLNLGTNSYECALNTTDKLRMKKIFAKHDIKSAEYIILKEEKDLEKIKSFPVVIKPSDRSAGRGVVKIYDKKDLKNAFENALSFSFNKIVLAEKELKGKQVSIECISSNKKHQVLAITREYFRRGEFEDDFLETMHLMPARLDKDDENLIKDFAIKILNAFEICYGASHIEIKFDPDTKEISVIEIASRMGGLRDFLMQNSLNINYLQLLLDATLKKPLKPISIKPSCTCLDYFIYTKKDYEFYKALKQYKPELFIKEHILANENTKFSYPSSLTDSHGYYYIKLDLDQDIKPFIEQNLQAIKI
ncbi:ATP-grasp domain-containing protein [Campylobacter sp. LR291e]|uniref:ATP-grasp domain-containing protein n=1 Tax=unclassified Campylobacter TaxID=2593542 RepID=UPI00123C77C8|nr:MULTISPECIES: ATP-grasp domain-containing protein [unclassified Campylobacter]KAA6227512.1 ATP-grasp domain-containing protein [Campylobacter sp. LR196d]KAA6230929.1 ATP-grasp domain-containing protein [Campylobacter sp. LR291e]